VNNSEVFAVLPGYARELLRLLREAPAAELRERLTPRGGELTEEALLGVLVQMELLKEDYLRLGRARRGGAREFQRQQEQELKEALRLASQVAESGDERTLRGYVSSLAARQGAIEAKPVRNESRRAWWHIYAVRLAELYFREIDLRAGRSSTGPAVRFVRAGLEHCCGLSIGKPNDTEFSTIAKALAPRRKAVNEKSPSFVKNSPGSSDPPPG
jgi:hypothetical protein